MRGREPSDRSAGDRRCVAECTAVLMANEEAPPMGMKEAVDDAKAKAERWNSKGDKQPT